jgi:hypothetical protein
MEEQLRSSYRYNAACSAALAGCGQGEDASSLDDQEKARLRGQALKWLQADLALWTQSVHTGKPLDRATAQRVLPRWQQDPDLAVVRDSAALAKLPPAERMAWEKLWQEVEVLRGECSAKAPAATERKP